MEQNTINKVDISVNEMNTKEVKLPFSVNLPISLAAAIEIMTAVYEKYDIDCHSPYLEEDCWFYDNSVDFPDWTISVNIKTGKTDISEFC